MVLELSSGAYSPKKQARKRAPLPKFEKNPVTLEKVNLFWTTKDLRKRKNPVHNLILLPCPGEVPLPPTGRSSRRRPSESRKNPGDPAERREKEKETSIEKTHSQTVFCSVHPSAYRISSFSPKKTKLSDSLPVSSCY